MSNKKNKKWLALAAAAVMALGATCFAACGDKPDDKKPDDKEPPATTDFVTIGEGAYKLIYTIKDDATETAAYKGTYIGGGGSNETYNTLSVGSIRIMGGCNGTTALELKDGNKYLLVKDLIHSTGEGVIHIQYTFEGTYTVSESEYTLSVPTSATAYEKLSASFTSNGVKPNYPEKKTSADDSKILGWFNTAYVTYSETATAQKVTLDTSAKTLAYAGTAVDPEPEVPEVKTLVEKTMTLNGNAVTAKFMEDGTYNISAGKSGKWYCKDSTVVAEDGVWNAETKTLTVSWYSGQAKCPVTFADADMTELAKCATPWTITSATTKVGDNTLNLNFLHDGTYKVAMGTTGIGNGTWTVEDKALTLTNASQGATIAFDAATKKVTFTRPSSNGTLNAEFTLSTQNAKDLGIVVLTTKADADVSGRTVSLEFYSDGTYRVAMGTTGMGSGTWKIVDRLLTLTAVSENTTIAFNAETKKVTFTRPGSQGTTTIEFELNNQNLMALAGM